MTDRARRRALLGSPTSDQGGEGLDRMRICIAAWSAGAAGSVGERDVRPRPAAGRRRRRIHRAKLRQGPQGRAPTNHPCRGRSALRHRAALRHPPRDPARGTERLDVYRGGHRGRLPQPRLGREKGTLGQRAVVLVHGHGDPERVSMPNATARSSKPPSESAVGTTRSPHSYAMQPAIASTMAAGHHARTCQTRP